MNVLSLFDGMSCGQIALERAGIKVDNYYASEIKKHAITKYSVLIYCFLLNAYLHSSALPAQPKTLISLCLTISLMLARAGFKYSLGSNLSGCSL